MRLFESQWPLMQALRREGSLAPCAASMRLDGTIDGSAFVIEDPDKAPSAEWVVNHFALGYRRQLDAREIRAAGVFFHGELSGAVVQMASSIEAANAIVAILEQDDGQAALAVVEYARANDLDDEEWRYSLPAKFSAAEGLPVRTE